MNNLRRSKPAARPGKIGMMEILVGAAVLVIAIGVGATFMSSAKINGYEAEAMKKMQKMGEALNNYLADSNGEFPLEDASGKDDWMTASKPEAEKVWYNALLKQMGATPVGEMGDNPAPAFYSKSYPLYLSGADYPNKKKEGKPYFAFAFNSRLQTKAEDGTESAANLATIESPDRTIVFLERGVSKKEKTIKTQGGYDGTPKANSGNFVGRYKKGKGHLVFADGHVEAVATEELVDTTGRAIFPQTKFIWTADPEKRPD